MLKKLLKALSLSIMLNNFHLQTTPEDNKNMVAGLTLFGGLVGTTLLVQAKNTNNALQAKLQKQEEMQRQKEMLKNTPFELPYNQRAANTNFRARSQTSNPLKYENQNNNAKTPMLYNISEGFQENSQLRNKLASTVTNNNLMTKNYKTRITELTEKSNHQETQIAIFSNNLTEIATSGTKAQKKATKLLTTNLALQQANDNLQHELKTTVLAKTAMQEKYQVTKNALEEAQNYRKESEEQKRQARIEAEQNSIQNKLYTGLQATTNTIVPFMYNAAAGAITNVFANRRNNSPKSTDSESIEEYQDGSFRNAVIASVDNDLQEMDRLSSCYKRTMKIGTTKPNAFADLEDNDLEAAIDIVDSHPKYNEQYKYTQMIQNAAEVLNPKNFRNDFKRVEGLDQSIEDEINDKARGIIARYLNRTNTNENAEVALAGFADLSPITQDIVETALINANEDPIKVATLLHMIKNRQGHEKA